MVADYPNREHQVAEKIARRRAQQALDDLAQHAQSLRNLLDSKDADVSAGDADRFQNSVSNLRTSLAEMAILADSLRWHEADIDDRERARYDAADPFRGYGDTKGMQAELTRRKVLVAVVDLDHLTAALDISQEKKR